MFDPLSLLVGAGLVTAGWVSGRIGRRPQVTPTATATCGCGHDLALHDPESRECQKDTSRKTNGLVEWVRCPCKRYTGPLPLDELFAPPILPPVQ